MDEYGTPITLSKLPNTSQDQPYDQNTLIFNGGDSVSWPYPHQIPPPPPSSSTGHHDHNPVPTQKKPRGRPQGSKNKPKAPIVITQDNDELMKLVTIEVSIGSDVIEALVNFAKLRNVGISVLSGSGSISNVTLHNPFPHSPYFTLNGSFTLVSLSGTYISTLSNPYPFMATPSSSSSSASIPNHHPYSDASNSFGISVLGSQGEILGGVVAGKVVAGSTVTVIATVFKKPEFHKVGFDVNDEVNGGEEDHNYNNEIDDSIISTFLNPQDPYANVNMFQ